MINSEFGNSLNLYMLNCGLEEGIFSHDDEVEINITHDNTKVEINHKSFKFVVRRLEGDYSNIVGTRTVYDAIQLIAFTESFAERKAA